MCSEFFYYSTRALFFILSITAFYYRGLSIVFFLLAFLLAFWSVSLSSLGFTQILQDCSSTNNSPELFVLLSEALTGFSLGLPLCLLMLLFKISQEIVSSCVGCGMGKNAWRCNRISYIGEHFSFTLALLIFVLLPNFSKVLYLVPSSFHTLPVGTTYYSQDFIPMLIGLFGSSFHASLTLFLPLLFVVVLVDMCLLIANRFFPIVTTEMLLSLRLLAVVFVISTSLYILADTIHNFLIDSVHKSIVETEQNLKEKYG